MVKLTIIAGNKTTFASTFSLPPIRIGHVYDIQHISLIKCQFIILKIDIYRQGLWLIQFDALRLIWSKIRPEFFNFSFYRPDRPEFSKIEKKIKVLFFNFIFRDRSDSPKKTFRFLVRYINFTNTSNIWFPSWKYWLFLEGRSQGRFSRKSGTRTVEDTPPQSSNK